MMKKPSKSRLKKHESKANLKGDELNASIDRSSKAEKQDGNGTFYRKDDEEIVVNEHILVCNLDDTDGSVEGRAEKELITKKTDQGTIKLVSQGDTGSPGTESDT